MKRIDLTGKAFGRLTIVEYAWSRKGKAQWRARCSCGSDVVVCGDKIRKGHTKSCGCLKRSMISALGKKAATHGMARHGSRNPTYVSWLAMRQRCENPRCADWPRYGARGIRVCPQWESFEVFLNDVGHRPEGRTLDRIDVDGNYEPGNVRWSTYREQNLNRRPYDERARWTPERRANHSRVMKAAYSRKASA